MDDGYAVGPKDIVMDAVQAFAEEVRRQCLLQLEWTKTEIFSWDEVLPAGCPAGITLAGEDVEGIFHPGFMCYGVAVGTPSMLPASYGEEPGQLLGTPGGRWTC